MSSYKWVVLLGPPAVGKSYLARKLQEISTNSKLFSFDIEFPVSRIENEKTTSKQCRFAFIEMIRSSSCEGDLVFIDDTCHLRAIQKLYLNRENDSIKVVFLYLSATNNEIPLLQERNSKRPNSEVTNEQIDKMTKLFNSQSTKKFPNLLSFNFLCVPESVNVIRSALNRAFNEYKHKAKVRQHGRERDIISENNFYHKLNLALSSEINEAFKAKSLTLDGKLISNSKKQFIATAKQNRSESHDIEELIEEFKFEFL